MKKIQRDGFSINGISCRTCNHDESVQGQGKIGKLWQDFFENCARIGIEPHNCYGVYSHYATDCNGDFDVTVGIQGNFPGKGRRTLQIPAGTYLCFEKQGQLPAIVLELWQEIWTFFQQDGAPPRSYLFDFEEYSRPDAVAIYIGIKEEI